MCDKCDYKSSISKNLNDHKKAKHPVDLIPCDVCEFVAKSIYDYDRHAKTMHAGPNDTSCKAKSKEKVSNPSNKSRNDGVKIPCDICEFTSVSADEFINHIESKHQKNEQNRAKIQYSCGKFDFKAVEESNFKKHLELAHKLNVGGWSTLDRSKSKKLCIYWNRGHCSYNLDCKFEHKEIAACTFKQRCSRPDCKYWHEAHTGKYPILDHRQLNPNPRMGFQLPRRN